MAGTTIATFKAALRTTLKARPNLVGVDVRYASKPEMRKEAVYLGPTEDGEHEPTGLKAGRRRREENYILHVFVEVFKAAGPEASEARACALAREVEEALADDPDLSGAVPGLQFAVVSGMNLDTSETTDGGRSLLDISVSVKGRLL